MKINTAAASAKHAPNTAQSVVVMPIRSEHREMIHQSWVSRAARKRARSSISGEMPPRSGTPLTGVRGTLAPSADHKENQHESDSQINGGHAPSHKAEAGVRRFGVNFGAELLNESLRDDVFGIAASNSLVHFLQHRGGCRATNVIALRQNLIAVAHAHELAGDLMSAIGLLLCR